MYLRTAVLVVSVAALLPAATVDEILKDWNKPDSPGVSVAVIQGGKVVFQKGYGSATLEYPVPITPDTVFHVASVSKQFTAMALVLLEQQKKLSLEDNIRKYLPEFPEWAGRVTIRNLLQHTGGVRDQWQTLALAGWRLDDVITQKQILRMMARQKDLNFAPGAEHLYSNGGYTLAAEIVARVSGKSFPDFCREQIFQPLHMEQTHFHDDHRRVVRNRAYSYSSSGGGFEAAPLNYANAGATSLFTTGPDLLKWLDNFRDPKVGGRAGVDRLQEPAVLTGGKKIEYGLGVAVGKSRGLRSVSHGGSDAGYRSFIVWFPDQETGIAVLSNAGNFNPSDIALRIAAEYIGSQMQAAASKPARAKAEAAPVNTETLKKYAGYYRLGGSTMVVVRAHEGKLQAGRPGQSMSDLKPLTASRFYLEPADAELEFTSTPERKVRLRLKQASLEIEGEQISVAEFDPADLPRYAGAYWSEELETQYTVRVKDGRLVADHAKHGEITLTPTMKDVFRGGQWFMPEVTFTRDGNGTVTGFLAGGGRVRGVQFVRPAVQ